MGEDWQAAGDRGDTTPSRAAVAPPVFVPPESSSAPATGSVAAAMERDRGPVGGSPVGNAGARPVEPHLPSGPLGFTDILDGAFQLYRASRRVIVGMSLAVLVPLHLLVAFVQRDSVLTGGLGGLLEDPEAAAALLGEGGDPTAAVIGLVLVQGTVLPLLAGGWIALASRVIDGGQPSAGVIVRTWRQRGPALLGAWWLHVLAYLVPVAPLALLALAGAEVAAAAAAAPVLLLSALLMPFFVRVAPAVVIEGLGPVQAIRRSVALTRRRYAATGGVVIGTTFVIALIATLISGVPEVIGFIGGFGWAWVLLAIAAITSGLIQGPLTAHTATLMFMDSRARLEGHDLVQRARNRRGQP
ncbi:putative integral membrane protein [Euzebya pacifica]|uniref:Putative integral membrane protein n=1 Tax=Euzebya pacifica TaxID=1608957 RepID=A0A346Y1X6_9ACTN|nr:hypothetical protein [Euzebya pacifica]AXV08473.1 putative integral membrane protein [Euzebya pacifica]